MKEMIVKAGASLQEACQELVRVAPAFMLYNGNRVEAQAGENLDTVERRAGRILLEAAARHGDTKAQELVWLR